MMRVVYIVDLHCLLVLLLLLIILYCPYKSAVFVPIRVSSNCCCCDDVLYRNSSTVIENEGTFDDEFGRIRGSPYFPLLLLLLILLLLLWLWLWSEFNHSRIGRRCTYCTPKTTFSISPFVRNNSSMFMLSTNQLSLPYPIHITHITHIVGTSTTGTRGWCGIGRANDNVRFDQLIIIHRSFLPVTYNCVHNEYHWREKRRASPLLTTRTSRNDTVVAAAVVVAVAVAVAIVVNQSTLRIRTYCYRTANTYC